MSVEESVNFLNSHTHTLTNTQAHRNLDQDNTTKKEEKSTFPGNLIESNAFVLNVR